MTYWKLFDPRTQMELYFDAETQKHIESPDEHVKSAAVEISWCAVLDVASGDYYYVNTCTHATSWVHPGLPAPCIPLAAAAVIDCPVSPRTSAQSPPHIRTPPDAALQRRRMQPSMSLSSYESDAEAKTSSAPSTLTPSFDVRTRSRTGLASSGPARSPRQLVSETLEFEQVKREYPSEGGIRKRPSTISHSAAADMRPPASKLGFGGLSRLLHVRRASKDEIAAKLAAARPVSDDNGHSLPGSLSADIGRFQLEGYAQKYFGNHRKGVFRRQVPIRELLRWTKDLIPHSLVRLANERLVREAVRIFKMVQMYMGDRALERAGKPDQLAIEILAVCLANADLRDETYCQLCKQTNCNPNPESAYRGWELLGFCLNIFPPTRDLERWLRHYIESHTHAVVEREKQFAAYALRRLTKICAAGARIRAPNVDELETFRTAPFRVCTFGCRLDELLAFERARQPDDGPPLLLRSLVDCIRKLNGLKTEGVFRVPGNAERMYEAQIRMDSGDYDLSYLQDPHIPANLLKLWLRELPEPLIPHALYEECRAASENAQQSLDMIGRLPDINRYTICFLLEFLQEVAREENSSKNKMTVSNLSMLFSPSILHANTEDPQTILRNLPAEQAFFKHLLTDYKPQRPAPES